MNNLSQTTINYMKLEEAIELVLKVAKRHAETYDQDVLEASNVVEDFFVNNVFDGTE